MTAFNQRMRCWIALLLAVIIVQFTQRQAKAEIPADVAASEVDDIAQKNNCDKIPVDLPAPGLLLIPRERRTNHDVKYLQPYHAVCHAYVLDPDIRPPNPHGYSQRFLVFAVDQDSKPQMIRVARLLLILWEEEHARLHHDHSLDVPTLSVWLTDHPGAGLSADTGGEQFKNQIYIYDILRERRPIEWAREVAHEYGHYALPGISGYRAPEEWANGVLGERLYLKWISEEMVSGRMNKIDMPFVSAIELNDYISKQVDPLIQRIDLAGVGRVDFTRRDSVGMDNYIALALYADHFYGSSQLLSAMSYTSPARKDGFAEGPDFLSGFLESVRSNPILNVSMAIEANSKKQFHMLYLAAGKYSSDSKGVSNWRITRSGKTIAENGTTVFRVSQTGWYTTELESQQGAAAKLQLYRLNKD